MRRYAVRNAAPKVAPWALLPLTITLMAASPHRSDTPLAFASPPIALPGGESSLNGNAQANGAGYEPAPVPDRDLAAPAPAPTNGAEVSPSLFMPKTQFRGDGYMSGSTSQSVQEKNVRPAAGFNVRMPLQ
jgi:hypothetical protein